MNKMKNIKRVLAFVLSICLVAACWTAGPLHAASTLYTSDEVENATYSLNGKKYTICYEDDFENEADYNAALGSYATHAHKIPWSQGGIAPDGATKNALFYGIKDAENMQNYSISADVKLKSDGKFTALVAHGASTSTTGNGAKGYEFGIVGLSVDMDGDGTKETTPCFRIYPRGGDTTNMVIGGASKEYAVSTIFEAKGYSYSTGDTVRLRLDIKNEADGVVMNCYAKPEGGDEIAIFTNIKDNTTKKIETGVPGFRTSDTTGGLISNVCITSVEDDDTCLYSDNFSIEEGYTEALGTEPVSGTNGNLDLNPEGYLQTSTGTSASNRWSLFNGIVTSNDETELKDYTVSADFVYSKDSGSQYNGIVAYGELLSDGTYGYEFTVIGSYFRLYRRSSTNKFIYPTSNNDTAGQATYAVKKYFTDYEKGETIRLSLTAITNLDGSTTLICKATYNDIEKEIFKYTDSSSNRTSGVPGIRGNQVQCTADNVMVQTNTQYLASLSTAYGDTLALGNAIAPYDIPKVDKMLAAYEGLEMLLDADTIAALAEIETFRSNWDTTSDETIAACFKTIYSSGKWDAATTWNVYQRLTASQKALLSDEYEELVTAMQNETQSGDTNISIGLVGETVPSGLADKLVDDTYTYSLETYAEGTNYDIIVLAKGVNEEELHSYLRLENSPLVVMTTTAASEEEGVANLRLAEQYGLAWVDSAAYVNDGGTESDIYADTILSIEPLFATTTVKGFAYDVNEMNSFLNPVLFSATIKNEPVPANQGLGFKTNLSKYQKTGASIESYGTIFARYKSTQSYDDMLLENVDNGKYFNANINVTDDSTLYGDSFIAGINLGTNEEFSRVYIARSYVKYSDGSVYYSMNTREDLSSSLATRTGVVEGQATRALTGVARNMVIALAKKGIDVSELGTYDSSAGKMSFNESATANDAQLIFEFLCDNQSVIEGIQNTVYVSNTGNDSNMGTENSPFATFEKALAEVPNGGIVWVKDTVTVASDFEWEERDYAITVTGDGALNFALENDEEGNAVYRTLTLGDDVTFDTVGLTFNEGAGQAATDVLYANGHTLVVEDDVIMTGIINLYGGGNGSGTEVPETNVILKTGNYRRIFGGSNKGTVTGNTNLYIGGNVNANADPSSDAHGYDIYGGGDGSGSKVNGCANITFTENAQANYILGGCRGAGTVSTTNVQILSGQTMAVFGGNDSSANIKGTHVTVTGGTIVQLFGANQSSSCPDMTEGVVIDLLGGTITRRVYGGCYNNYTTDWAKDSHVTGTINLNISSATNISFTSSEDDLSIYACSRYNPAFEEEVCTITFADTAAYNKYNDKLGYNDTGLSAFAMYTVMGDVEPADIIQTNEQ